MFTVEPHIARRGKVVMKSSVEEISPVKKKLIVEIEAEEVDRRIAKAYKQLGKQARIPGFRPGKIPVGILEGRFGKEVLEDVTRDLVNETLPQAMQESGTYPLSMPVIENDMPQKGHSFRYTAVLEVKPEIELKDYQGFSVEKEILSVTDEDVEKQVEEIRRSRGKLHTVEEDRGVQEGDYVAIRYEGFEDDQPVPGLQSDNHMLRVGSGEFHPDFEKRLVGLKKGTEESFRVDFEDDPRNKKLAGKNVDFKVEVQDMKAMELPDLDDEFAKGLGEKIETLEEMRNEIRKELTKREERRIDQDLKTRLLQKICDTVEFELPESLVEEELNRAIEGIQQNLSRSGSGLEQSGLDVVKLRQDLRTPAESRVKRMLVLSEIAQLNQIEVTEDDLSKGFAELAEGIGQEAELVRRYYEANNLLESYKDKLLEEKTLNYLVEGAKIFEVEADKISKENSQ